MMKPAAKASAVVKEPDDYGREKHTRHNHPDYNTCCHNIIAFLIITPMTGIGSDMLYFKHVGVCADEIVVSLDHL